MQVKTRKKRVLTCVAGSTTHKGGFELIRNPDYDDGVARFGFKCYFEQADPYESFNRGWPLLALTLKFGFVNSTDYCKSGLYSSQRMILISMKRSRNRVFVLTDCRSTAMAN